MMIFLILLYLGFANAQLPADTSSATASATTGCRWIGDIAFPGQLTDLRPTQAYTLSEIINVENCALTPETSTEFYTITVRGRVFTAAPVTVTFKDDAARITPSAVVPDLPLNFFVPGDIVTLEYSWYPATGPNAVDTSGIVLSTVPTNAVSATSSAKVQALVTSTGFSTGVLVGSIIGCIIGAIILTALVAWLISSRKSDQPGVVAHDPEPVELRQLPSVPPRRMIVFPSRFRSPPPRATTSPRPLGAPENQTQPPLEERANGHINSSPIAQERNRE